MLASIYPQINRAYPLTAWNTHCVKMKSTNWNEEASARTTWNNIKIVGETPDRCSHFQDSRDNQRLAKVEEGCEDKKKRKSKKKFHHYAKLDNF